MLKKIANDLRLSNFKYSALPFLNQKICTTQKSNLSISFELESVINLML